MKMKGKRLFSLFMALLLIAALIPSAAFADPGNGGKNAAVAIKLDSDFGGASDIKLSLEGYFSNVDASVNGINLKFDLPEATDNGLTTGAKVSFTSSLGNGYITVYAHEGNDTSTDSDQAHESGKNNYEGSVVFWKDITTSIPVIKNLVGVPEGTAYPQSIEAELLKMDGTVVQTITLTEETGWTGTFEKIPAKDESGQDIVYNVNEKASDDLKQFEASYAVGMRGEFLITNTYTGTTETPPAQDPVTVSIPVFKNWVGVPEGTAYPQSIEAELLKMDGTVVQTVTLTAENGWAGTFENVPAKDESGQDIVHNVNEKTSDALNQFEASYAVGMRGEFLITNTYTGTTETPPTPDPIPETTSVSVNKVWVGVPEGAELPPVTIKLLVNGNETDSTVTLNAENEWTGSWTELDITSEDGAKIEYTVAEVEVPGYTSVITPNENGGFTITNPYVPQTPTQNPTIIPPYVYIPPQQETPKAELPAEAPVVEVPEEEVPLENMEEADVPLAEFEEVEEMEAPLSDVPKTGDESNMTLWMLIMAISAAGAMMSLRLNRKED